MEDIRTSRRIIVHTLSITVRFRSFIAQKASYRLFASHLNVEKGRYLLERLRVQVRTYIHCRLTATAVVTAMQANTGY